METNGSHIAIEPGKRGGKPAPLEAASRHLHEGAFDGKHHSHAEAATVTGESGFSRGMPRWRERQRSLPVADKVELIGRFILETRELERVKKSCRPFATS